MIRFHERNRRIVLIIALTVTLILSMTAVSFSWFSNNAGIDGVTLSSGQITAHVRAYRNTIDNDSLFYDAQISGVDTSIIKSEDVTFALNPEESTENMFIILLNEGSDVMSLNANLSFFLGDLSAECAAQIGGYEYKVADITSDIKSVIANDVDIDSVSDALASISDTVSNSGENNTLVSIDTVNLPVVLTEGDHEDYAVFMLTCTSPSSPAYDVDYRIGFDASFVQFGGTIETDSERVNNYFVYSEDQLSEVLDKLVSGDSLYIMDNISLNKDFVIETPVNLFLCDNTLTVTGNVNYTSNGNAADFKIDTTDGGKLVVSGDFVLSVSDSAFEFFGSYENTDDIKISGDFKVNASYDKGIIFDGCSVVGSDGATAKDIILTGNTTVNIASAIKGECPGSDSTETSTYSFGSISAINSVQSVRIVNHNTVTEIDLSNMIESTGSTNVLIYIENYNDITGNITLPEWADTENTNIVYRLGSDISKIGSGVIAGESSFTDDDISIDTAPVPASRDHQFGVSVVTEQPQCLSDGSLTRKCSICGYTENSYLSALGHSYDSEGVCVRCGSVRSDNAILARKAEPAGHGWQIDTTHGVGTEGTAKTVTLASGLSGTSSLSYDICITGTGRENDSYITLTGTATNNAITFFPVNDVVENGPISTPELYDGEFTFDVEWGDFAIDNWHNVRYEFTTKNSKNVADIYIDDVKCGTCNYTAGSSFSIEVLSENSVIIDNIKIDGSLVNDFEDGQTLTVIGGADNCENIQHNVCTVVYNDSEIGNAYALVGSDFTITSQLPDGKAGWSLTEDADEADFAPNMVIRMPDVSAAVNLYPTVNGVS